MAGILYLIPSPLGESSIDEILPADNVRIIKSLKHFIVEDERTARRFLKKAGYQVQFDEVVFYVLNQHTPVDTLYTFIEPLIHGIDMGIISEAGVPAVADPGAVIVAMAHEKNIKVKPLVGPSSIILAIMAAGMNGQQFHFHGYLPVDKKQRVEAIRKLESQSQQLNCTQVFIETPYRNMQLFDDIVKICHHNTFLCVASELTTDNEYIVKKRIEWWKKNRPDIDKKPAVFLLFSGDLYANKKKK